MPKEAYLLGPCSNESESYLDLILSGLVKAGDVDSTGEEFIDVKSCSAFCACQPFVVRLLQLLPEVLNLAPELAESLIIRHGST